MKKFYKFWAYLLAPLLVVGTIGFVGRGFVVESVKHNPVLNLAIVAVIAWGILLIFMKQVGLWNEARALVRFSHVYHRDDDLPSAMEAIRPSNTRVAVVLGMVARIGKRIESSIDHRALSEELGHLKDEYELRLALPHFLSGFMVALGLFGTFIGLLETLKSTSDLLGRFSGGGVTDMGQVVTGMLTGMRGPLSGMATSFSASLFGLLGSLLLGIMLNSMESMSHLILQDLRELVDDVVLDVGSRRTAAGSAPSADYLHAFLERILEQQQNAADLFDRTWTVQERQYRNWDLVAKRVEETSIVTERIASTLERLMCTMQTQADQNHEIVSHGEAHQVLLEAVVAQSSKTQQSAQALELLAVQVRDATDHVAITQKRVLSTLERAEGTNSSLIESGIAQIESHQKSASEVTQRLLQALTTIQNTVDSRARVHDTGGARGSVALAQIADSLRGLSAKASEQSVQVASPRVFETDSMVVRAEARRAVAILLREFKAEMREIGRLVAQLSDKQKS
jgi:hypothetical protein